MMKEEARGAMEIKMAKRTVAGRDKRRICRKTLDQHMVVKFDGSSQV